ncbi:methyltransferase domain-containing protein [Suttonella sp. R2A3]|uniref:methyltransferase domain-containing protein n=1 Tax=Suttonella sp. R2A3 TaxID=2908648 RepID=UPI001F3C3707|nr:methyltransferase domain-containing protein [Suttonella sp. R2A3]UJF24909.1 methyltransferase domain-containing protein [Suttonella sp. R2A3]
MTVHEHQQQLAAHFSRHLDAYHQYADHQRGVADRLAQRLCQIITRPYHHALEIGCGSGFLTTALAQYWRQPRIARYGLNDLYQPPALNPPALETYLHIGDISKLLLPASLDLVLSASVFQWIEPLDELLRKLHQTMHAEGIFACSLYAGQHYQELRETLGIGLNYRAPQTLFDLFTQYFQPLWSDSVCSRIYFTDPHAVLTHIRDSGLHALSVSPTFSAWRQFRSRYARLCDEQGYPLTQDVFLFIGRRR